MVAVVAVVALVALRPSADCKISCLSHFDSSRIIDYLELGLYTAIVSIPFNIPSYEIICQSSRPPRVLIVDQPISRRKYGVVLVREERSFLRRGTLELLTYLPRIPPA